MIILVCAAIFGLLIGSFLNVVILRLPEERTLGGRSLCPHCGYRLAVKDLVPVFSYIQLRGRCRSCKARISFRYPLIELLTAAGFVLAVLFVSPISVLMALKCSLTILIITIGIATFIIDLEHYLILDVITLFGVVAALCIVVGMDIVTSQAVLSADSHLVNALQGIVGGVLPFLLLWYVSGGKWLGFGDVKFMAFIGVTLGFPSVLAAMLFSFWIGALCAIPLLAFGKRELGSKIPFGTFLVVGQGVAYVWGGQLLQWYTHLFV